MYLFSFLKQIFEQFFGIRHGCKTKPYFCILLIYLRLDFNPKTKLSIDSPEKIYAEYLIASFILYFVCKNFMG